MLLFSVSGLPFYPYEFMVFCHASPEELALLPLFLILLKFQAVA